MSSATQLTLLYDGGCPLCLREVTFLQRRDRRLNPSAPRLAFVDINRAEYNPAEHADISYRAAMGRIHAIAADGEVLRDVAVFRAAYQLIGLGWLYAPPPGRWCNRWQTGCMGSGRAGGSDSRGAPTWISSAAVAQNKRRI